MTTFLKNKKKPELVEIAELTNLQDYRNLKKEELTNALDDHLKANATTYSSEPSLSEYYKTTSKPARSPVKKAVEKVMGAVTSDEEQPKKKADRRKTTGGSGDASGSSDSAALATTPAVPRRSSMLAQTSAPTSPAQMVEIWDKGRRRVTETFEKAYKQTSINDYIELARDNLSSPAAINILAWVFELYSLGGALMPYKKIYELPAVPYLYKERQDVSGPDVFMVLEATKFWAPLTLWLLTSTALPALVAYFINIPLKASPAPAHATRSTSGSGSGSRSSTSTTSPVSSPIVSDWFMFNIAKGLICYLVYADHMQLFRTYSNFTIATVNEAVYGGYAGMLTAAGIGAAASLYEAVLKK